MAARRASSYERSNPSFRNFGRTNTPFTMRLLEIILATVLTALLTVHAQAEDLTVINPDGLHRMRPAKSS